MHSVDTDPRRPNQTYFSCDYPVTMCTGPTHDTDLSASMCGDQWRNDGVAGWLLRLVTGGPDGIGGPRQFLEFL